MGPLNWADSRVQKWPKTKFDERVRVVPTPRVAASVPASMDAPPAFSFQAGYEPAQRDDDADKSAASKGPKRKRLAKVISLTGGTVDDVSDRELSALQACDAWYEMVTWR